MRQSQKANLLPLSICLGLVFFLSLSFQNCSQVEFDESTDLSSVGTLGNEPFDPTNPTNQNKDLISYKPALAIRNAACFFCHSSVKGNVITDFFQNAGGQAHFFTAQEGEGEGDYVFANWTSYGARSFLGSSYFEGDIITPKIDLDSHSKALANSVLTQGKSTQLNTIPKLGSSLSGAGKSQLGIQTIYDAQTNVNVNTLAGYINAVVNHRTEGYLEALKTFPTLPKVSSLVPNAQVREVQSVRIKGPSSTEIRRHMTGGLTYYKSSDLSANLSGFQSRGTYFGNEPGVVMNCEGDLFVDGVVYLKDLKLNSQTGCRIYSSRSIFVEAAEGTGPRPGVTYLSPTVQTNLQLASSQSVTFGLGACAANGKNTLNSRQADHRNTKMIDLAQTIADSQLVKNSSGQYLLKDAGNCLHDASLAKRKVSFERLLVASKRVDSRYTGTFRGVIVAEYGVWSLGNFKFEYDSVFNSVPTLPRIPPEDYFQIEDCIENGVDKSVQLDEKFRSCSPQ